jgi:hypothetical protein
MGDGSATLAPCEASICIGCGKMPVWPRTSSRQRVGRVALCSGFRGRTGFIDL